jgi:hypothetical protein
MYTPGMREFRSGRGLEVLRMKKLRMKKRKNAFLLLPWQEQMKNALAFFFSLTRTLLESHLAALPPCIEYDRH